LQAADDLQAIYDFIGHDSPYYAQVIVEDLLAAIESIRPAGTISAHGPTRTGAFTRGPSRTYQTTIPDRLSSWRSDSHSHNLSRLSNVYIQFGITLAHVLALDVLPFYHKDPFDRLLIEVYSVTLN
jgi:hypothetical protein